MLTQQRLREVLDYNPQTGIFKWRRQASTGTSADGARNRWAGKIAGASHVEGYRLISVDNEKFRGARLAWLYMTGEWPQHHVDHIDGNPSNDAWANLREATRSENMCNTKTRADNLSGARGVSWNARKGLWHARVNVRGKLHHCGYFKTIEEAKKARDTKAEELHGAFARFDELSLNQASVPKEH